MNHIEKFILVVLLASILDACWTFAIIYTTKKRQILASLWTGLGYFISAINVLTYVDDKSMIGAVVLGSMIGCFLVVKYIKEE